LDGGCHRRARYPRLPSIKVFRPFIVFSGIEAGGHGGSDAPALFTFLQAVLGVISNGPLIIAAGGITTGAQVAALLTMGVDGVALGTRFLYTHECMYPDLLKTVLIESDLNSTTRGMMFDEVNRTPAKVEWPAGVNGRAISNKIVQDAVEGLPLHDRMKRVEDAKARGEKDRLIIWAGDGVGIIKEIKGAAVSFLIPEIYLASIISGSISGVA
jgi:nitronate monooxygenase